MHDDSLVWLETTVLYRQFATHLLSHALKALFSMHILRSLTKLNPARRIPFGSQNYELFEVSSLLEHSERRF